jgi:hypothetical protein
VNELGAQVTAGQGRVGGHWIAGEKMRDGSADAA